MNKQMLLIAVFSVVALIFLGAVGGIFMGNMARNQTLQVSSHSLTASSPEPADSPQSSAVTAAVPQDETQVAGTTLKQPMAGLPENLQPVTELRAPMGSIYLLDQKSLRLKEAEQIADLSVAQLLELLYQPGTELLQAGYCAPLPPKAEVNVLGTRQEMLYVLLTIQQAAGLSSRAEAVMLDALVLSLTSFPGVERVQFLVDPALGYQGRVDLSLPRDRDNLCSIGIVG